MIKKMAFLEIVVDNFKQMLEWYTNFLFFRVKGEIISNQAGLWCQLETFCGDDRLALWRPAWKSSQDKILYSFIPVFEVDNLESFATNLKNNGATFIEDIRIMPGYKIITIVDPENNRLQLYEPIV